jgi:hypothetical protein
VKSKENILREDLGSDASGRARFRLRFDPPITDKTRLSFRFQVPMEQVPDAAREIVGKIPWIVLEDGRSGSTSVELSAKPGISLALSDPAWRSAPQDGKSPSEEDPPDRYVLVKPEGELQGVPFAARILDQVPQTALVVPRALFRTVLGHESDSRTRAWFWIESHPSRVSFRLPDQANWIRARVDGRTADQLEFDPATSAYRLRLPSESTSRPVLLEIEFQEAATGRTRHDYSAPQLLDENVILQTLWQIQVPWNLAVIGVPEGWADENQWYWDLYVWKRKPSRVLARLVSWVSNAQPQSVGPDEMLGEDRDDSHAYLFSRSGPPAVLKLWVAPRGWIVGISSGLVLLFGFYLMYSGVRFLVVWVAASLLCLLSVTLAHPSVVALVVQSAVSGVILALLGLLIHRLLERSRSRVAPPAAQSSISGQAVAATPLSGSVGVGSDDSTAIRVRGSSTTDYPGSPMVLTTEQEPAGSSRRELSG